MTASSIYCSVPNPSIICIYILDEEDEDFDEQLNCIHGFTPFLFDLAKFSPQPSGEAVRSVLQEKFEDYLQSSRNYPTFEAVSDSKDLKDVNCR